MHINNKRHKDLETSISNNLTMKIIISFGKTGQVEKILYILPAMLYDKAFLVFAHFQRTLSKSMLLYSVMHNLKHCLIPKGLYKMMRK